jgi:hypothetical protein
MSSHAFQNLKLFDHAFHNVRDEMPFGRRNNGPECDLDS